MLISSSASSSINLFLLVIAPSKTEEPSLILIESNPKFYSHFTQRMKNCFGLFIGCPKTRESSCTVLEKNPVKCIERDLNLTAHLEVFTFNEVRKITKKFSTGRLLGRGKFGSVYKGFIDQNLRNGLQPQPVAVRVLDGVPQSHKEWLADVKRLGHHYSNSNLVKLIGYTCEEEHHILIYEYLALGSVKNHLYCRGRQSLSWHLRMKVAYGVAKGLTYMHEAENPIILGKITPSNILFDEVYRPKLSYIGYVKYRAERDGVERGHHVLIKDTVRYAPEFLIPGHLSSKSDVYSFGVLLLELLTGRKPYDRSRPRQEQNLVLWARPFLEKKRKCLKILDPRLDKSYPIEGVYKVAMLTYHCLSYSQDLRPSMREAMEDLKPHLVTGGERCQVIEQ